MFVDSVPEFGVPDFGLVDVASIDAVVISNYHNMLALPYITENPSFR